MACGTHVFLPKFVPDDVLDAIEKHQVNRAMMVPAMIAMMLQSSGAKPRNLASLANVYVPLHFFIAATKLTLLYVECMEPRPCRKHCLNRHLECFRMPSFGKVMG